MTKRTPKQSKGSKEPISSKVTKPESHVNRERKTTDLSGVIDPDAQTPPKRTQGSRGWIEVEAQINNFKDEKSRDAARACVETGEWDPQGPINIAQFRSLCLMVVPLNPDFYNKIKYKGYGFFSEKYETTNRFVRDVYLTWFYIMYCKDPHGVCVPDCYMSKVKDYKTFMGLRRQLKRILEDELGDNLSLVPLSLKARSQLKIH